uniref:PDZ domain-containing protein n=1 Tax=Arundo donax TaxID=35708 RepID=A0A0A9E0U2_ARUDO
MTGGRLTRSRARELGLKLEIAASPELGGRKGQKRRHPTEKGPNELEPLTNKRNLEKQNEELKQKQKSAAAGAVGDGSVASTITDPQLESSSNPASNLPTLRRKLKCRSNAQALSVEKKLLAGAPGLVHVSSTSPDGKEILRCSGIVIHWEKEKAWILTSYLVVFCTRNDRLCDPMPKLAVHVPNAVHLPNSGIFEGDMLFFNEHYQLAVLKIEGETMVEMEYPRYGDSPCYGGKVLAVARDEKLSFKLCRGTITWLEEDHFLYLNCKLCPCGIGGLVINDAGDVIGMLCDDDRDPAILCSTTIRKCVEMWTKFGHIARPVLGMCLRTVYLVDISHHDRLRYKFGINNGFIVEEVIIDSAAEKRGIRRGNVITSFDGMSCCLPEFEDFLLSVGMASLNGMKQVNDFKLEVHDLLRKAKRTIILPIQL